ncbi:MAG: hypothetical protein D6772_14115 [Bacteroidetes bacterium]|nr:MAG: hypothetical protein D6772_14115 [Bacteroidota bacterium]
MIALLRKLWQKPASIVDLTTEVYTNFQLYPDDDFGRRWREIMQLGELPHHMTEDKLLEHLLNFSNSSVQARRYELRHLLHHISPAELKTLSAYWWSLVVKSPWIELSLQRLLVLPQQQRWDMPIIASQNLPLARAILALHLHLHQRDAMRDLLFFIVQCERNVPRLGKAAPYLARAARRLQRSYGLLPRFRE